MKTAITRYTEYRFFAFSYTRTNCKRQGASSLGTLAQVVALIAECDLFVCVGSESDEWVEEAPAEAVNKDMQIINLPDVMGDAAKEEEVKEGMEHDHDHDEDHDDEEHDHEHGEEEAEYDEHVMIFSAKQRSHSRARCY